MPLLQLDQRVFQRVRAVGAARAVRRQAFLFAAGAGLCDPAMVEILTREGVAA